MTHKLSLHRTLIAAVAANLLFQLCLLGAFAAAGEWRVWRFLIVAVTQIDALLVLGWFGLTRRKVLSQKGDQ
jgi:hypothetical protein